MSSVRLPRAISAAITLAMATTIVVASSGAAMALGVQAVQVSTGDTGNGRIDHIVVKFNTPMKAADPRVSSGPGDPGFRVAGYTISGFEWKNSGQDLHILLDEGVNPDTAATPTVVYEQGGGAESAVGVEADAFNRTALDRAGPALLSAGVDDQGNARLFNSAEIVGSRKGDQVTLTFSEPARLAGTAHWDRWVNLEKAIRFNNEGACANDGRGDITTFNFPQPRVEETSMATVITPEPGAASATFVVRQVNNSIATPGSALWPGVPQGCWLGIESDVINTGFITDAADNPATNQAQPGRIKVYPTPVDASLLYAFTKDLNADGAIDALELTFDQGISDDSVAAHLSDVAVTVGGAQATLDVAGAFHPLVQGVPNPKQLTVPFTAPAGARWDSAAQPRMRYTKPTGCTSGAGTPGLKAEQPTPGFFSCVASFDVESYDGAKPIALDAVTTDSDLNGRVDAVTITFSEPLKQGAAAGWKLDGQAATDFVLAEDGRTAEIPFAEGAEGNTGDGGATVTYETQTGNNRTLDHWDNQVPATQLVTTDGAAPRITDVVLTDADADGVIDTATLTYSEAIVEPDAATAGAFRVGGVPASSFMSPDGDAPDDATLTLAVQAPGTEAKTVSFSGASIADALGNAAGDQTVDATRVTDQAAPQATIDVSPSAPLGVGTSTVTVTFTEGMDTATAPTVSMGATSVDPVADAEHTNGFRNDDAAVWEGTVQVAEGDCTVSTGCEVTVSATDGLDPAGNTQGLATFVTEIDTVAPQAPTLGTFSTLQASGPDAPAFTVNRQTRQISIDAGIVAGDAEGGRVEILVDGSLLNGSQVSPIDGAATSVTAVRTFTDLADLQGTLAEGAHTFGVRVCDDAGNCSASADAHDGLVDTAAIDVALTAPNADQVVAGGDTLTITWDADETATDLDHIELDLSTDDGATYATIIDHGQVAADGSYDWTIPALDVNRARVRVTAVDAAGNRTHAASGESFAIDSTAPVVTSLVAGPFVDDTATITWSVQDATLDRVAEPIGLEYSTDGGSTWQPINGGSYSGADDGTEVWNVPAGPSFALAVRLTATDATDAVGTGTVDRIASGVAGYVADATGEVVAFGTADPSTHESKVKAGSWAAAVGLNPSGVYGVTVSGRGSIFPFAIGDRTAASKPRKLRLPKGSVRDVVLTGKAKGYVLDEHGELHAFGGAREAHASKIWRGDMARAVVLNAERTGGWVLSAKGHIKPFAIGNSDLPSYKRGSRFGAKTAVDFVMNEAETGALILRHNGRVIPVGQGVSRPDVADTGSDADARALVMVTATDGYWIGPDGALHAVGAAFGNPATETLRSAVGAA